MTRFELLLLRYAIYKAIKKLKNPSTECNYMCYMDFIRPVKKVWMEMLRKNTPTKKDYPTVYPTLANHFKELLDIHYIEEGTDMTGFAWWSTHEQKHRITYLEEVKKKYFPETVNL